MIRRARCEIITKLGKKLSSNLKMLLTPDLDAGAEGIGNQADFLELTPLARSGQRSWRGS